MQVHEVVDHPRLQVVLQSVDDDLAAHIDDLAICHVLLVLIERLIHPLIHLYPLPEVLCRLFGILTSVVRTSELHLLDVAHDQVFIVALALHEERLYALGVAAVLDPAAARLGGVGGIKNGDQVVGRLEPFQHVVDGCFSGGAAEALALLVRGVEEAGGGLRGVCAAV